MIILIRCLQFSSFTPSCPTLCKPTDCSTPGFPVHHQLPKFAQTHVHGVGDAIQPSHPLSSPSPPAFNLSQGLFCHPLLRLGFPGGSEGKASAHNAGDPGSIPWSGGGNGNPLQYSYLENPMDGEAWCRLQSMGRKESDMTERLHFLSLLQDLPGSNF